MTKKTKIKITAIVAVAVIAVIAIVNLASGKNKGELNIIYETSKVEPATISTTVTATGTIEPVNEVEVGTQVSGIISKIYVDYNSIVKKGQVIAELDRTNLESELTSAKANLTSAKSELNYQTTNLKRVKELHKKGFVSDDEYDTALLNYNKALESYKGQQQTVSRAQTNLGYATITSPIDGVVLSKDIEEGQTVASSFSTPTLFTIAHDLTDMRVIADVDEADIGNVENGQRVSFTVDAYPNDVFEGTVMQIRLGDSESTSSSSSTSTSTVVTYEVVISADNPDLKLKPRLTANVTIFTLERDNVLTVPTKSLRFVPDAGMLTQLGYIVSEAGKEAPAGKRLVWIKNGQELKPKAVTVGSTSGNMIEITDGLNEGEELAVDLEASSITPAAEAETERSPFMPGPPGSNKNKKSAK